MTSYALRRISHSQKGLPGRLGDASDTGPSCSMEQNEMCPSGEVTDASNEIDDVREGRSQGAAILCCL